MRRSLNVRGDQTKVSTDWLSAPGHARPVGALSTGLVVVWIGFRTGFRCIVEPMYVYLRLHIFVVVSYYLFLLQYVGLFPVCMNSTAHISIFYYAN